jgi:hypothetical protein
VTFKIDWIDRGLEPQCPPDPKYPNGIDLDTGERPACKADLPYPTPRCGLYFVKCERCDVTIVVTTAGRPDDPRSVYVTCGPKGRQ